MTDWTAATKDFRLVAREGDRVRVSAPNDSMAYEFQHAEGVVSGYCPQWVIVRLDETGHEVRLRPDELLVL